MLGQITKLGRCPSALLSPAALPPVLLPSLRVLLSLLPILALILLLLPPLPFLSVSGPRSNRSGCDVGVDEIRESRELLPPLRRQVVCPKLDRHRPSPLQSGAMRWGR